MPCWRVALLTALALAAFAGNSVLCRLALQSGDIDPARFTAIRLAAGALALWALVRWRSGQEAAPAGSWTSALALFAYAAGFSFAYVALTAGTGALLLFAAVQVTMVGHGLARGERLGAVAWLGLALAMAGLVALLWPGLAAPPPGPAALMLGAGVAWGIYSLRGRGRGDPIRANAANFLRTVPLAILLALAWSPQSPSGPAGIGYALASGALASGLGYAIWYAVLPSLRASSAATVQLAVPVLVAVAGVAWLGEVPSLRLVLSGLAVLGGVALVLRAGPARSAARHRLE